MTAYVYNDTSRYVSYKDAVGKADEDGYIYSDVSPYANSRAYAIGRIDSDGYVYNETSPYVSRSDAIGKVDNEGYIYRDTSIYATGRHYAIGRVEGYGREAKAAAAALVLGMVSGGGSSYSGSSYSGGYRGGRDSRYSTSAFSPKPFPPGYIDETPMTKKEKKQAAVAFLVMLAGLGVIISPFLAL